MFVVDVTSVLLDFSLAFCDCKVKVIVSLSIG